MKIISLILAFLLVFCFIGCEKEPSSTENSEISDDTQTTDTSEAPEGSKDTETSEIPEELRYTTYVYEGEGVGGLFSITLMENGSFSFYEGMFSSYIGMGRWKIEDGILTLTEDRPTLGGGVEAVNRFRVEGDSIVFIEEGSYNFYYLEIDDGARFNMVQSGGMIPFA